MTVAEAQLLDERLRRMAPVSTPGSQRPKVVQLSKFFEMIHPARKSAPRCHVLGPKGERVELPETVLRVLERVAEVLARGDAITVIPIGQELTTQQAADMLNVSRQYLVRLVEQGKIPFTKTGKHRRLRIEDVLEFKKGRDLGRKAALRKLTQMSQELGGYRELG